MIKSLLKSSFLVLLFLSCNKIDNKHQSKKYDRIFGDNSWGYIDEKGKIIIPLGKYKFLNPPDNQGMIFANRGNKYGYIDINENIIVPFEYDDIGLFNNDLAYVKKNHKFGFINRKGTIVIPIEFDSESNFNNLGLALVEKNHKFGFIDKLGKEVIPIIYEQATDTSLDNFVIVCKNKKWAFYNKKGEQETEFIYDEIAITKKVLKNHDESTFWQNGLILVKKNGLIGYLDKNLKEIIPFGKYNSGERFNQNRLAIVSNNHHYGVINEFDQEIIKTEYDTIEHPVEYYNESTIFTGQKKGYFVLFDEKGTKVADKIKEFHFDNCKFQNKHKKIYQFKTLNDIYGVIDNTGNIIIPSLYQEINDFHGEQYAIVKQKGKFGIIGSDNTIVYPINNDNIFTWKDIDYYIITKNQKAGIIDKNLKSILSFEYQSLFPIYYDNKNRFIAKQNDKYGVIDRMGRIIIPFKYSELSNWVEYGPGENYHFVTENNKKGLITGDGKNVIPPIYETLFYHNDNAIILSKNKKYGVINLQNKVIIPFLYDNIYLENNYFESRAKELEFYVEKDGKYFVINDKNKQIRQNVPKEEIKDKLFLTNPL
jgi:hypothetical protein